MFKEREFYLHLVPTSGRVILGDGKSSLQIKGVGTIKCEIGSNILSIDNVRWVPDLSESVYSLFLHIQCPGHRVSSSFEDGLMIFFPDLSAQAIVGANDIYLDAVPYSESLLSVQVDDQVAFPIQDQSICNHITQFQSDIDIESSKIDNVLLSLRQYHNEVKTKRQLTWKYQLVFAD
jgi:hypothetical protein